MSFFKMDDFNNYPNIRLYQSTRRAFQFQNKIENAIRYLKMSDDDRKRMMALMGLSGFRTDLRLSDTTARIQSTEILYQCVGDHFRNEVPTGTPIYFGTFICDTGLTNDRTPHLRMKAFIRKVYRAIHDMGLSGIGSMEVQALDNYRLYGGVCLMLHAHVIMWGNISTKTRQAAVRELNASKAWSNHFGAKPVKLTFPKVKSGGAEGLACYITKLPDYVKRLENKNGKLRFSNRVSGYSDRLALRIMEGLSHYSIRNAVFGVGDGKFIRKEWISQLMAWHQERIAKSAPIPDFDVAEFLQRVRADNHHGNRYGPFRVE